MRMAPDSGGADHIAGPTDGAVRLPGQSPPAQSGRLITRWRRATGGGQQIILDQLLQALDDERGGLGEQIHEEPIQQIVTAIVQLDQLREHAPADVQVGIDVVTAQLEVTVDWLRRLIARSLTTESDPTDACGDMRPPVTVARTAMRSPVTDMGTELRPPVTDARTGMRSPVTDTGTEVRPPVTDASGHPWPAHAGAPSAARSGAVDDSADGLTDPADDQQSPRTIVVCDDHRDLRGAVTSALADLDRFRVVGEAWDARSCLHQITDRRPDLLVLDVGLPGGGPALARAVKSANHATRIVVFSGRDDEPTQRAMLAAGADDYVVKTGRLRQLIQALDHVC